MRESCMSESVREASSDRRSTLLECPRKRGGWIKEGLAHGDPLAGTLRLAHEPHDETSNAIAHVIMAANTMINRISTAPRNASLKIDKLRL